MWLLSNVMLSVSGKNPELLYNGVEAQTKHDKAVTLR